MPSLRSPTRPVIAAALVVVAALVIVIDRPAQAQVFSPGALSKAHAPLDGLTGCTKCHVEGAKHDNGRCLDCHKEIARRTDAGVGYHNNVKALPCFTCHREHRGLETPLIQWQPSKAAFNHGQTGWPLTGKHRGNDCRKCHEPRLIVDDDARKLKAGGRDTMLGLDRACVRCHFDEHRGQEGNDCSRCHGTDDFKKAGGFNHNDKSFAAFALTGKHKAVACTECHRSVNDPRSSTTAFPPAKSNSYLQFKDIAHKSCVDCHDDHHNGSFGNDCQRCHTTEGWRVINATAQDTGFHDKHAFKLRGAHTTVQCRQCHGPFGSTPAVFKGLKFKNCADCHTDAHVGQLDAPGGVVRCESCHDVGGFLPVNFDVARHDKTRYPLTDAHRTVACNLCHDQRSKLVDRVPRSVRDEMARRGRRVLASNARLQMSDVVGNDARGQPAPTGGRCEVCHTDESPHGQQFSIVADGMPGRRCVDCHSTVSFRDNKFDHNQSRFALTGKHKTARCNDCHVPMTTAAAAAVKARRGARIYRPIDPVCVSCHDDVHVGQLQKPDATTTDCAACHTTTAFKPPTFDHDRQAAFRLEGAHKRAQCTQCHIGVDVEGRTVARYKPVPTACDRCHEDEHKGLFDPFSPLLRGAGGSAAMAPKMSAATTATATTTAKAAPDGDGAPREPGEPVESGELEEPAPTVNVDGRPPAMAMSTNGSASARTLQRCDGCHGAETWFPAKFAHERTGFPLDGRHQVTRCADCHGGDLHQPLPKSCASCHHDPHLQEFGLQCASCHNTERFEAPLFVVDAHRRTNFPLTGRHAALPCDECHVEKRDRQFTRAAIDCVQCHAADARRATTQTVNHQRPPFSLACGSCHTPATFVGAKYRQHDTCFPITRGSHTNIRCADCHGPLNGFVVTGNCKNAPARCADCHEHNIAAEARRHARVPGYEHKSQKCAECHRNNAGE